MSVAQLMSLQMESQIIVRLFVDEIDPVKAAAFTQRVRYHLAPIADIIGSETKVYWKIPEWFEVSLLARPFAEAKPLSVFDGILTVLGQGWEKHVWANEEQWAWAVWNPKPNCSFCWQSVRWANVELHPFPRQGR